MRPCSRGSGRRGRAVVDRRRRAPIPSGRMVIERERRGRVEILAINRPEARNAVNADVAQGIEAALDDVEADNDVWAVVVTGRGPVFSAGADLKAVAAGRGLELMTKRGGFGGVTQRAFPKPLIAAVNGPALAGGGHRRERAGRGARRLSHGARGGRPVRVRRLAAQQ